MNLEQHGFVGWRDIKIGLFWPMGQDVRPVLVYLLETTDAGSVFICIYARSASPVSGRKILRLVAAKTKRRAL
jgi:hypothetical protein